VSFKFGASTGALAFSAPTKAMAMVPSCDCGPFACTCP
jgi:hypothetical protein